MKIEIKPGAIIGDLEVIRQTDEKGKHWEVKCKCGYTEEETLSNLKFGLHKRCSKCRAAKKGYGKREPSGKKKTSKKPARHAATLDPGYVTIRKMLDDNEQGMGRVRTMLKNPVIPAIVDPLKKALEKMERRNKLLKELIGDLENP